MFHYLFERVNLFYEKIFFRYGKLISHHYIKIIIGSFMLNLILSLGMVRIDMVTNVDKLFFPIQSQAKQDENLVKGLFNKSKLLSEDFFLHQIPDFGTWAEINFQTCSGKNILNESYLQKIRKIHELVVEMADLDTVCAKRNSECLIDGVDLLEPQFYQSFLHSSMERKSSLYQWDPSYDKKNFRFYVSFSDSGKIGFTDLTYNLGKHFKINFQNESNDGKEPAFARLVKLRYNLKDNNDNPGPEVKSWELKFLDLMKNLTNDEPECNDKDGIFKISYASSQSLDIEMTANVNLDIKLVVGTFSLIIIFACFFMSLGTNLVTSPSYVLPFAGIASAFFGITSSFGLLSYLNYSGCNLIFVIPFLVIGIGIDDMFLIYSSFQHVFKKSTNQQSKEKIIEETICQTLTRSGVSITVTSLTDFTAFLVGITTGFKSVQIFCVYAGISILFCYFYQITFFTGFLCLHCRRVLSKRNAFVPCLKAEPKQFKIKFFNLEKFKQKWLKFFEFLICHKIGKLITTFLFLIYISVSAWNAYKIHEGIELQDLVSEDSYYSTYVQDNSELNDLYPIVMLVMQEPIDYDNMQNRILINNLLKNSVKIKGVSDQFSLNWLDMFKSDKIGYKNSPKNLINTIKTYPPFLNDIVIKKTYFDHDLNQTLSAGYFKMSDLDSTENIYQYQIEASRFYLQYSELYLSSLDAIPMHLLRKACQESGLPVFPYSITFKYYEQFEETLPNVVQSFIIALESMYLIALIFIPDLVSVFCIIASMLSIMTGLVGFMHIWGLSLSSITMIELIMSVGFCVDFSAHVTHAFITNSKGDRNRRAYKAFLHVGVPIFNSAISTIVGISLLGLCKSYIFKSFFKTMIILMTLGILNSLLFLPVLLSLIGPNWPMHQEIKQQNKEEEMVCLNGQKPNQNA